MNKPELLAPGGSFGGAYAAFAAGADGVYLGLKEFSARKGAQNFSLDQLRRIRQLAADGGKKVYVAVNTVIRESELARLFEAFTWLAALAVDGVIVQDLGACDLLRKEFPDLPIHASTQMAVHNDTGLRMAEELGIRRVILSRELSLDCIRALRQRHPGIELEVFIHGALCYSFSGACLASSALTGRSANRGDCAQICRSLFHDVEGEHGKRGGPADWTPRRTKSAPSGQSGTPHLANSALPRHPAALSGSPGYGRPSDIHVSADLAIPGYGHYFSARDLFLGREVLALADVGIDAFKIEGRMKSPEYAYNVTRLYREILDRGADLREEEYTELVRRADLSFTREKTSGWLHSSAGQHLIDQRFPGHRGSRLGTVQRVHGREILIDLRADLSLRDGLGFFPEGTQEPLIFSVSRIMKAGHERKFARAGEVVGVEVIVARASAQLRGVPRKGGVGGRPTGPALPPPGAEIRHLSSRFLDLPMPKEAGFPLYRVPLDMQVSLSNGTGYGDRTTGVFSVRTAGYPVFKQVVTIEMASNRRPFVEILGRMLEESGDSIFRPGRLSLTNETGLADDEVFVPPSQLKKAKNALYRFLDAAFISSSRPTATPSEAVSPPDVEYIISSPDLALLAHRQVMARRHGPGDCADIPFVSADPNQIDLPGLFLHAGYRWLPLPPVLLEDGRWIQALQAFASGQPDIRLAIGLNNLSHLAIASALRVHPNIFFFADFYLYVANCRALSFIREHVPRLLFAYAWIEGERGEEVEIQRGTAAVGLCEGSGKVPIVALAPDFRPPLFYSLGCFARHVSGGGKCLGRPSANSALPRHPAELSGSPGSADWTPPRTKSAPSGQSGTPHLANSCPRDFTKVLRQGRNRFQLVVRDCVTYLFARGKE